MWLVGASASSPPHRSNDDLLVKGRVRIVHPDRGIALGRGFQIAPIVSRLLVVVPGSAIDLHDHPALYEEINTADIGDDNLRLDQESSVTKGNPHQGFDPRLGTWIDVGEVDTGGSRHCAHQHLQLVDTQSATVEDAVDDSDRLTARLAAKHANHRFLDGRDGRVGRRRHPMHAQV